MTEFIEKRTCVHNLTKPIVVCYHGDCSDGFGAAWAAWKKFGTRADYLALHRDEPVPKLKDKEVYMIDFLYVPAITKKLIAANRRVTGIDHHITARESTLMTHEPLFDNDHSGAVLAWKYFHPGKPVPKLLQYIEDRDIWKWKLPHTREILQVLDGVPWDFHAWSRFARDLEQPAARKRHIAHGKLVNAFWERIVKWAVTFADPVIFEGHRAYAELPKLNALFQQQ